MSKRLSLPSAHDVARLAGVSQAAVSRAFTPGASIAQATQDKVFQAAKSLGYLPNMLARSLIKGESGIIGVVIGNPRKPIVMASLDELSARLSRARKHILVFTANDRKTAEVHVEDLLNYRVDALLLMTTSISPKLAERCRAVGIRVVFFNGRLKTKDFDSVIGNEREGARQIAEHLLSQGFKRLAFIAGTPDSSASHEREAGFVAHLTSKGMRLFAKEVGHFEREATRQAVRNLLRLKQKPDAIFCANDSMALAAIEIARHEFALKVGRDIGIAGFDDIEESSWPSFELTTHSLPVSAMIEAVSAVLLGAPGLKHPIHTIVPGDLKQRSSTRRDAD